MTFAMGGVPHAGPQHPTQQPSPNSVSRKQMGWLVPLQPSSINEVKVKNMVDFSDDGIEL